MFRNTTGLFLILACLGAASCLPNPQSVEQRRESFDRSKVQSFILKSEPENIQVKSKGIFDERVKVLGFDADKKTVQPGEYITITLYFKVLKRVEQSYKIFMHLDGSVRVHGDHWPVGGDYPTDVWMPGEIIKDVRKVRVLPHFDSNNLNVNIGFFIGKERMPISNENEVKHDGKKRLWLGSIPVDLGK